MTESIIPTASREELFDGPEIPEIEEPDEESMSNSSADQNNETSSDVSRETKFPRPIETRIIVIANQKGGVGKTTTAVNIAAAFGFAGLKVLLIDMDPQGNASTALGIDHRQGIRGTYEVLLNGDEIAWHVQQSQEAPGVMVLPATIDLAASELELVSIEGREHRLSSALDKYLENHEIDYVIFDCPPSLGLLTLNALVAATEIMIPIQCEYYALEGVTQLIRTIDLVKGNLNNHLRLSTVLLTMFDSRTRLSTQVQAEVRNHFPHETLNAVIPRSVRIAEAPSYGQTVMTYHSESTGAKAYLAAAEEIANRSQAPRRGLSSDVTAESSTEATPTRVETSSGPVHF
jgi:chromosome partitioning protein